MRMIVNLTLVVLGILLFAGCSSKNYNYYKKNKVYSSSNYEKNYKKVAPEQFKIRVGIENGQIVLAKVLNDIEDEIGIVTADGIYFYLDKPILKLDAQKFQDHYWVVEMPVVSYGNFVLDAYRKTGYLNHKKSIKAPLVFKIVVDVKDKIVTDHYIEDANYYWGTFQVYKIDDIRKRVLFTNNNYTGYLWASSYKNAENGRFVLTAKLIEENAHED
jgi:hypothetical protein